jgi:ATP-binding cassette subfamily B protein
MASPDTFENLTVPLRPTRHTRNVLWRSYRYLKPYYKITLVAYLALTGYTILNLIIPQLICWIIDQGIRQGQTDLLVWSAIGLLGLNLVRAVATFIEGRWSEIASQNVAYD